MPEITKKCHASNREGWRKWLEKNHSKKKLVWLIKHKRHTGKPALSHKESMEEAICFGWIDTIVKRIDENTFARCFVKRTDKSRWSNATLGYAKDMIKKGLMTEAGLKRYKEGLKKPTIDHGLPKNPKTPKELKEALAKHKKAKAFFESLAPSYRRYFIWWLVKAKREETKKKRLKQIVQKCKEGKKW